VTELIGAKIIESGNSVLKILLDENNLYVKERDLLWLGLCDSLILNLINYSDVCIALGGVWGKLKPNFKRDNKLEFEAEFIDVFKKGLYFSNQKYFIQKSYLGGVGELKFLGVDLWNEEGLYLSNLKGEVEHYRQGDFRQGLIRNAGLAYVRGWDDVIFCVNEKLEDVWKQPFNKRCFTDTIQQSPQLSEKNNLVIVNVGEKTESTRGEFELNAYAADSGEMVWQQILESTPCTSNVIEDKVYIVVKKRLVVVDGASGDIEVDVEHGFTAFSEGTHTYKGLVYPLNEALLCISPTDRVVQLRSKNGQEILQTVSIPEPYKPDLSLPVVFEGKVYLPLSHVDFYNNTMKGAFVVMTQGESGAAEIEAQFEQRPPMSVELTSDEFGEVIYKVSIEHNHLDDVIRFSTIALKETAFKYGSYSSATHTNKDHQGRLLLQVKSVPLAMDDAELLKALAVIKERVERNLKETVVLSGDGAHHFKVDICLL